MNLIQIKQLLRVVSMVGVLALPACERATSKDEDKSKAIPASAKPVGFKALDLNDYQCFVKNWKNQAVLAAVIRNKQEWGIVHGTAFTMGNAKPAHPDDMVFKEQAIILVSRVVTAGKNWENALKVRGVSESEDTLFVEFSYTPPKGTASYSVKTAAAVRVPNKDYKQVKFIENGKEVATLKSGEMNNGDLKESD
jgi:hypothetical protein